MHITEYRRVLMGPSKKFQPDRLEPMLRKIYTRLNRRAPEQRADDYKPAPHLQRILGGLAGVKPQVVEATLGLLDARRNPLLRQDRSQFIPLIWALGKMKNATATAALAPLVRDSSEKIRAAAITALAEINDPRAIPDLLYHYYAGESQDPFHWHGYYSGCRSFPENEEELLAAALSTLAESHPKAFRPYLAWLSNVRSRGEGGHWECYGERKLIEILLRKGLPISDEPDYSSFDLAETAGENLLAEFNRPLLLTRQNAPELFQYLLSYGFLQSRSFCFDMKNQKLALKDDSGETSGVWQYARGKLFPAGFKKEDTVFGDMKLFARRDAVEIMIKEGQGLENLPAVLERLAPIRDHIAALLEGTGALVSQLSFFEGEGWGYRGFSFTINLQ